MVAVLFIVFLVALAIGVPVAFSLGLASVAYMLGAHIQMINFAQYFFKGLDSFTLLCIPGFTFAGNLMNQGGISEKLLDFADALVGHITGGLAYANVLASMVFAGISGTALSDTVALGGVEIPMMVNQGYDVPFSVAITAASSVIGPIIPPSTVMIMYGITAQVSISKLFLAGIVPGVLLGIALAITWWWLVRREKVAPPARASRAEVLKALRESVWALGLPVIILVGLRMGVFTPTEAAVVAAVYALFVAMVVYRELSFRQLADIFQAAARTSAVVMFLVAAAMVSAWLITVADLPSKIIGMLEPFMGNQTLLLVAIMLLVMIVGTAMDMTPTILILTPVLMPVVKAAGIDPVYFGVLFIINNAIGLITPPVGTVLNVVAGVGRISMSDVTRGVMPFMLAQFIVMFLLVAFPSIVMVPLRWLGG
jgi:tripartite ATP-independent transporter DctM subunit